MTIPIEFADADKMHRDWYDGAPRGVTRDQWREYFRERFRDDPDSVVDQMTRSELQQREQQVEGRMKRKMLALRRLFDTGAGEVVIADGRVDHPVRDALAGRGTIIR